MITGISGCFFCPKMAVAWRIIVFQTCVLWNPYFYSVLVVCAFWAKLSKKGIFGHPPKKENFDNWKAHFLVFFGLSFFVFFFLCFFSFLSVVFFEGLRARWGGPKGHLTWPYTLLTFLVFFQVFFWGFRATSLGPKPSLFCVFLLFLFSFLRF